MCALIFYLECKESTAPAAEAGHSTRKCDPEGDKATKCTYTCANDDTKTLDIKCNAETGEWDPKVID